MKNVFSFYEFLNENKKLPTTYKYTGKEKEREDKSHDRLAAKNKEGHSWKNGSKKKFGEKSMRQNFVCRCGYEKEIVNNENKDVTITYKKK